MTTTKTTPAAAGPAILSSLIAAQKAIGAVRKTDRNTAQGGGYFFRGVDAVVNAASPAFHEQGIVVVPEVLDYRHQQIEVGKGRTLMEHVMVRVKYTFRHVDDGSEVSATVVGAAGDSGDKATPKAMSVALRTALLQALMLPTDEPDPDSYTYGADDQRDGHERHQPEVEQPSDGLIRSLTRCAPDPKTAVPWVQEQARARNLDLYSRVDMERLLEELQAQTVTEQSGGQPVANEVIDPETGEIK